MKTTGTFTLKDLPIVFNSSRKNTVFYNLSTPEIRNKYLERGCKGYLLSTEIITLLSYFSDLHQRTLIYTLWNTGIDINEIRLLTRRSFILRKPYPYIKLQDKPESLNSSSAKLLFHGCIVPLLNKYHVIQLKELLFFHESFHSSKVNCYVWDVDSEIATSWLNNALARAYKDGVQFPVSVNLDMLKRSYVSYLLTQGIPPIIIQKLLLPKEGAI